MDTKELHGEITMIPYDAAVDRVAGRLGEHLTPKYLAFRDAEALLRSGGGNVALVIAATTQMGDNLPRLAPVGRALLAFCEAALKAVSGDHRGAHYKLALAWAEMAA